MLIHPGRALEQCSGGRKREQLLRPPGQPYARPRWPGQSASQGHLQSTAVQSSTCQDQLYQKNTRKKTAREYFGRYEKSVIPFFRAERTLGWSSSEETLWSLSISLMPRLSRQSVHTAHAPPRNLIKGGRVLKISRRLHTRTRGYCSYPDPAFQLSNLLEYHGWSDKGTLFIEDKSNW